MPTHFANAIQVDGSDVTPEFSGGAPTDGGGSGTFDVSITPSSKQVMIHSKHLLQSAPMSDKGFEYVR